MGKSFFSRLVDNVNEWSKPKKHDITPALKTELPSEYFKNLGIEKESKAIKEKENKDSIKRGAEVAKKVESPKAENTSKVSTPSATTEPKKEITTIETPKKSIIEEAKEKVKEPKNYADKLYKDTDELSDTAMKAADNWSNKKNSNTGNVADSTTKDNIKRVAKYLGGGVIGNIADTIGIYGDMVSTAKHNLAQAYFQAGGKGAQYKDPIARELLTKKINTMIDSVAETIKENNTKQANEGFRLLGMTNDEAYKVFGKSMYMIGKYMDTANSESEAVLMADFVDSLKDNPKMKDPNFRNALYVAMRNPNEKMVLAGSIKGDPKLAEDYIFANEQLALANTKKGMAEATVTDLTKNSVINMTNSSNEFNTAYNKMKKDNVSKKFELELQQLIYGNRIMGANASDAEINNRINAFSEKWKKYGVAKDQIAGTVKSVTDTVGDIAKIVK